MKTISFIVVIALLIALLSCKRDKNNENKPSCEESGFSGTWIFTINKDQVNEYKDTLTLQWNSNTYIIDGYVSTRGSFDTNLISYSFNSDAITINLKDCNVDYKGYVGRKL